MRWHKVLFILAFCVLTSNRAFGVQSRISDSKLSGVIAHPIIAAIHRDRFGFLWIGTQEGLYKFDGATHTLFSADEDNANYIPVSDIRGISEDKDGHLLLATYGGGLLKWDTKSGAFVSSQHSNSTTDDIVRLHVAAGGNIWLGTKDRIVLHNSETKSIDEWLASQKVIDAIGRPYALVENNVGALFVGSDLGLVKILTKHKTIVRYNLSALNIQEKFGVTAIELDDGGNLFIGTDTGHIAKISSKNGNQLAHARVGENDPILISDFALYGEMLLIASDKGLFLSDRQISFVENISRQGSGLSNNDIYSLNLDGNQIWVGTYNGLDILSLPPFDLFTDRNSSINNEILSFAQDESNRIWVGTYDGLYIYNDITESHSKFEDYFHKDKLKDNRVAVLANTGSQMWLGYIQGGIQVVDIATGIVRNPNLVESNEIFVRDISADAEGNNVWIATSNHGLIRITPEKTYHYKEGATLDEKGITKIFRGHERFLLVSATNRIYEYDQENDRFLLLKFNFGFGIAKTIVLSIAEDKAGNVWFGTKDQGLFKWTQTDQVAQNLHVSRMDEGSGLKSSTVYGIEIDSNGNLWCSTQNGVIKLSSEGKLIKRFTTADGLQGNDFTLGASFKSRQGLMYFGGINGYNRFDPNEIEIDSTPSPMRLTGVSLPTLDERNLGDVADLKSLQLTHKDRFVTFQFSVLDFIGAGRSQFRYKLENFDTEWIENGASNTATYTSLPAGQYVFRAQGANSAGIWNREGITLNVTVLPAPWFTWWAYTLYGLVSLCLFWGMHRIYRSYAIDKKSALLAQEMFEADSKSDDDLQEQLEYHDELVRSAYQHNLTTLRLVGDSIRLRSTNLAEGINRNLADGTVERISALFGLEDCLSYQAGGPVANLYEYTERIIPALIERSPVSPETIVTINEVTDIPIPAELASPISIILFELVENCIQHAFKPESPANYIHIKLITATAATTGATSYELSVHDSGIGLSDSIEELARNGRGIAIVQFIASKIRAQLQVSQGSGTTIRLVIPSIDNP